MCSTSTWTHRPPRGTGRWLWTRAAGCRSPGHDPCGSGFPQTAGEQPAGWCPAPAGSGSHRSPSPWCRSSPNPSETQFMSFCLLLTPKHHRFMCNNCMYVLAVNSTSNDCVIRCACFDASMGSLQNINMYFVLNFCFFLNFFWGPYPQLRYIRNLAPKLDMVIAPIALFSTCNSSTLFYFNELK